MDLIVFVIVKLFLIYIDNVRGQVPNALAVPDFESKWISMRSQNPGQSVQHMRHDLGEMPLLVDVQVKSEAEPNMDYIFPAIGGCPRDDDNTELYGGITYIYDDKEFIAGAPSKANDKTSGFSIYTANGAYFAGANNQSSHVVSVRFRAWKASSLPVPDFHKTDISVKAGSLDVSKVYIEEAHGLSGYPCLVVVRAKLLDGDKIGYMSHAVGASLVTVTEITWSQVRYFVHGFNDQTVRVWISSEKKGFLYAGTDGYSTSSETSKSGLLEIYAWKSETLQHFTTKTTHLGPNIVDESFEMPLSDISDISYIQVWSESLSGLNAGYRFPGSGALAYEETQQDDTCSYGGLVYGYSTGMVRFWRPTDKTNGGIICIASLTGQGINAQRELDANIVVNIWGTAKETESKPTTGTLWEWEEVQDECRHTVL